MTEAKKEEKAKAEEKKEVKVAEKASAKGAKPKAEAQKEKPKKEEKVDIVSENVYTIPLRAAYQTRPKYRITSKAVNIIRVFLTRHAKAKEVRIDADLNAYIWARGDTKPPRKIQVKAVKDSKGIVKASLVK